MFLTRQVGKIPNKTRILVETCAVGLTAGVAAVGFQVGIDRLSGLIYGQARWPSPGAFLVGSLVAICVGALLTGFLLNKLCPEAAGSGIPQLKLAFWKDFGNTPPRIAVVKFVAGVVGIGGGLSLGREGPSVQIGGNLGSTVAGVLVSCNISSLNKHFQAVEG